MTVASYIPIAMGLPLLGGIAIALSGKRPNLRESLMVLTTIGTLVFVFLLAQGVNYGLRPTWTVIELFDGIAISFTVEPLGALYGLVASGLWIPTAIYAIGYMRGHQEVNQTRFYVCFALAISAALGIAFAGNLVTLFICYEALTLSTYPLVTHHQNEEAKHAGRIYLGNLIFTSVVLLLLAIVWTWHLTGTTEFQPGGIISENVPKGLIPVLLALFAFGTGKAALMPFHRWLPAAMVAPTPVSALLHAVAVVKAGVFTVVKIVVYVFGPTTLLDTGASEWLMWVAAFTLLASSVIALTKDNLKARLAYSTISQLSYIVLGAAIATPAAIVGAGLHIPMHAMGKITLFFCAGAIYVATHKKKVSELDGIGRKMPFTMTAFFIGSLSIIGLPPTGGCWSKFSLGFGAIQADQWPFVAVLMISSLLSIGYLMPIVGRAFFLPLPNNAPGTKSQLQEAPLLCVLPLCATAIGTIILFFAAPNIQAFLLPIVSGV